MLHVQSCYLVRGDVIHEPNIRPSFVHTKIQDAETALCANFRDRDVDMFVSNLSNFGHLISVKDFDLNNKEFFELEDNALDWEKRYLHADYRSLLDTNSPVSTVNSVELRTSRCAHDAWD